MQPQLTARRWPPLAIQALCKADKRADEDGACKCDETKGYTSVGSGKCMKLAVLIVVIIVPILVVLMVLNLVYVKVATRMADSIWEIREDQLIFGDKP